MLVEVGAERRGHFRLTSGLHSDFYMDKDQVSVHPRVMREMARELARRFRNSPAQVVVGPAYGAIVAAHVTAQELDFFRQDQEEEVLFAFGHKDESNKFVIRKSMRHVVAGRLCLAVEDILTTGTSAKQLIEATLEAGAAGVVGLGVICNRGGVTKEAVGLGADAQLEVLLQLDGIKTYSPVDCPMCQAGTPLDNNVGHGGKK